MARFTVLFALGTVLFPAIAFAHAFAEPFVTPVPLHLYIVGSTAALIASFCFFYFFSTSNSIERGADFVQFRPSWMRALVIALKIIGVLVLLLTAATALFGSNDYTSNPAPSLFWLGLILAMAYFSALVDGVWAIANPFENIARLSTGDDRAWFKYPEYLGCIPALVLYYALICLELFSNGAGGSPGVILWVVLGYLLLSLAGSVAFGPSKWFAYGDFFNVFFGTIGLAAPMRVAEKGIIFYKPLARLTEEKPADVFRMLFMLLILASTAFDGFAGTQFWSNVVFSTPFTTTIASFLGYVLFAAALPLFFSFYAAVIWILQKLTHSQHTLKSLLLRFSYSLVPIAIGYNIAHYFTWFVSQGLNLLAMLSDPFARGWNLFGTRGWAVSAAPLSADTVWYIQVGVLVLAHIIATYVAHKIALYEFKERRTALVSQLPMLVLMIGYTVLGLWILSQPVGSLS